MSLPYPCFHWPPNALANLMSLGPSRTVTSNGVAQLFQKRKQDENKMIYDVEPTYVEDDLVGLTERQKELATARRVLRQASWATVCVPLPRNLLFAEFRVLSPCAAST